VAFIQPLPDQEADDPVSELFAADRESSGYVANMTRLLARPGPHPAATSRANSTLSTICSS
jgi:hypothetical protein